MVVPGFAAARARRSSSMRLTSTTGPGAAGGASPRARASGGVRRMQSTATIGRRMADLDTLLEPRSTHPARGTPRVGRCQYTGRSGDVILFTDPNARRSPMAHHHPTLCAGVLPWLAPLVLG